MSETRLGRAAFLSVVELGGIGLLAGGRIAGVSMEHPYADTLTLHQTMLPSVMLAHSMDGAPLSRAHGAPLRLVIPEMYGYKNVKWVPRIELVSRPRAGYWDQCGYDVDARVGRSTATEGAAPSHGDRLRRSAAPSASPAAAP
jgi:DMSO/TMAO reductase YedYZ molybdopterin-dependent catalytic subunit